MQFTLNKPWSRKTWLTYRIIIQLIPFSLVLFALLSSCSFKTGSNYGLKVISSYKNYNQQVLADTNMKLVDIQKSIPTILLDLKYATTDNFSGVAVYKTKRAYARNAVVKALNNVQGCLKEKGMGLKIYDAYRPYRITKLFWNIIPSDKKDFVANPKKGSRHNRGCAVDVTLVNLKTGIELPMPTTFDSFKMEAQAEFNQLPETVLYNRKILQDAMLANGFEILKSEWWHFDFKGWQTYDLMDIDFKKLSK